jgi:hypothetical protein
MEKSTKLIIAAVGLGGLGFFLYKKGLFGGKTTKVVDVEKPVVDTGKKTGVEPPIDTIKPKFPVLEEAIKTPIWQQTEIYPVDVINPQEGKLAVTPPTQTSFQPYLYDRLPVTEYGYNPNVRLDYTTGKYNDGMPFDYIEKDLENIRRNQLLYV